MKHIISLEGENMENIKYIYHIYKSSSQVYHLDTYDIVQKLGDRFYYYCSKSGKLDSVLISDIKDELDINYPSGYYVRYPSPELIDDLNHLAKGARLCQTMEGLLFEKSQLEEQLSCVLARIEYTRKEIDDYYISTLFK